MLEDRLVRGARAGHGLAVLRAQLDRAGLRGWKLAPLAPNAPFLIATPPRGKRVGTGKAWEYVYRLRADRDVDRAEPAFETVGLDLIYGLPKQDRERVFSAVEGLREDPVQGMVMSADWKGFRRLRVGQYRVIYAYEGYDLLNSVVRVGHRREVSR